MALGAVRVSNERRVKMGIVFADVDAAMQTTKVLPSFQCKSQIAHCLYIPYTTLNVVEAAHIKPPQLGGEGT